MPVWFWGFRCRTLLYCWWKKILHHSGCPKCWVFPHYQHLFGHPKWCRSFSSTVVLVSSRVLKQATLVHGGLAVFGWESNCRRCMFFHAWICIMTSYICSNYSDLTQPKTRNDGLVKENIGWWNIIIGNGLVCTRGQGPHLYTRPRASSVHAEWVCCMYQCVLTAVYFACSMCAGSQVQVFSNRSAGSKL